MPKMVVTDLDASPSHQQVSARVDTAYQPQLDGLRAIAIIFVLIEHFDIALPPLLRYGPLCVRFFFVLSGYFITLSLWKMGPQVEASESGGTRHLINFYLNRLIRVGPPYYCALALGVFLGIDQVRDNFLWLATFQANNYIAWLGYWPESISHFWSLSVQEQFYVLWPLVVFCVPRRYFMATMVGLVGFGLVFRLVCIGTEAPTLLRWVTLLGCIDSFAVGALVAWMKREGHLARRFKLPAVLRSSLPLAAFGCLFLGGALMTLPETSLWLACTETIDAFFLAWLLIQSLSPMTGIYQRVLSFGPLVYLGRISYGIYVYHVFVIICISPFLLGLGMSGNFLTPLRMLTLFAVTFLISAFSWAFIEKPFRTLKDGILTPPRDVVPSPVPVVARVAPVAARPLVLSRF